MNYNFDAYLLQNITNDSLIKLSASKNPSLPDPDDVQQSAIQTSNDNIESPKHIDLPSVSTDNLEKIPGTKPEIAYQDISREYTTNKILLGAVAGTILGLLGKRSDEPFNILYPIMGAVAGYFLPDSVVDAIKGRSPIATQQETGYLAGPTISGSELPWLRTILATIPGILAAVITGFALSSKIGKLQKTTDSALNRINETVEQIQKQPTVRYVYMEPRARYNAKPRYTSGEVIRIEPKM